MRVRLNVALAAAVLSVAGCSKESEPTSAPAAAPAAGTATEAGSPPDAAPAPAVFSPAELDQMVAPIALYSDPLLAQVLMAATYPGDVADAAKWSEAHPDAQGDDAVRQVSDQPWDPSVQSLVAFPQALALLGQDPAWVQRLGDAFLAQPDAVMDAVQRLRHQAADAGNLASNEYQNVTTEPAPAAALEPQAAPAAGSTTTVVQAAPAQDTIIIQPSDPEVVYVPTYNPTQVYGTWSYPSYPPTYYPPPSRYYAPGSALVNGMMWGVGVAITDSLWGDFNWGHDDIDIDINRYNNFDFDRDIDIGNNNSWQHNSLHRDGVPYRDQASRERYGRQLDNPASRDAFRGDTANRTAERERARQSLQSHGVEAPARNNQEARARAQDAARAGGVAGADRDAARERAGNVAQQARDNPQARERAQSAAANHPQARDRAQAAAANHPQARQQAHSAAQQARANPEQARQKAAQRANKPTTNTQARQAAQQAHRSQAAPRNNAFSGASRPSTSQAHAARGQASRAHAAQPRSTQARQVNRQPRPQGHAQRGGRR